MLTRVDIDHAATLLPRLLEIVEAGNEVVICRSDVPVARLTAIKHDQRRFTALAVERVRAMRASGGTSPVTVDEILAWRHEGHAR